MIKKLSIVIESLAAIMRHPFAFARYAAGFAFFLRGQRFGAEGVRHYVGTSAALQVNPLTNFYLHRPHAGMTKWKHYLDAFLPHFTELRDRCSTVRILEIGVFAGGSLELYRDFFHSSSLEIVGVDISTDCRTFAGDGVTIEIGDQAKPDFWQRFLLDHEPFDIIIDDGGHSAEQQSVSITCLFNHLRPGGLYVVEDVGATNRFNDFIAGLTRSFHAAVPNGEGTVGLTALQENLSSIETIPYAFLLRKRAEDSVPRDFACPWVGTSWTPAAKNVFRDSNPNAEPPIWNSDVG